MSLRFADKIGKFNRADGTNGFAVGAVDTAIRMDEGGFAASQAERAGWATQNAQAAARANLSVNVGKPDRLVHAIDPSNKRQLPTEYASVGSLSLIWIKLRGREITTQQLPAANARRR